MGGRRRCALTTLLLLSACNFWQAPQSGVLPPGGNPTSSPTTNFQAYRYKIPGLSPRGLGKLDAFNRGLDDIVVATPGSSSVTLFKNRGNGTFQQAGTFETCPGGGSVDGEDISGDGNADFIVTCTEHATLSLFLGDGHGNFVRHDISVAARPLSAQIAPNMQAPGTPYLAVLHDAPARLELFFNQGGGRFSFGFELPTLENPTQMVADVFTHDGVVSYALVSPSESKFSVFLNRPHGYERSDYNAPEQASGIAAIDLRATGMADLVVSSGTQNIFRIYQNDGSGKFPSSQEYPIPEGAASGVATTHFRGVSRNELSMQSQLTGDILFYPNLGNGSVGAPEIIHAGAASTGLITGHFFHHSDDMDLAVIDTLRGELVLLLNEHPDFN